MAGQQKQLLGCLWQDEGGWSRLGNIMSGKAGRVVGKEVVGKFRRHIGAVMIVAQIFAQLRTVTFVTSQVTRMGQWGMGSTLKL